ETTRGQKRRRPENAAARAWLAALRGEPVLEGEPAALAGFAEQFRAWTEAGDAAEAADTFRVCLRLDPPAGDPEAPAGPTPGASAWRLDFLLQATDDPSLLVPAGEVWRQRGATGRFLNRRFDSPHERLLAGLGRASRLFPPLEAGLRTARPETCALTTAEAHDFLREKALLLRSSGFGVLVPALETKLAVRVRLRGKAPTGGVGRDALGWNRLVDFDWELALGDETLTRAEFE